MDFKNLVLLSTNNQIGGKTKIFEKKFKMVEFVDKKIYVLNNMDNEKLDDLSEFPIGSITKVFTIISLLILNQNKQIDINNKIGKYIDNDHIKNLKIIDIINHKSGLKNYWNNATYGSSKIKYKSATEIYNKWNDNNLIDTKTKGTQVYSNMGFHILGVLIEKISNMTYSDFVKNNILIPLNMTSTGIEDCNITLYDHKLKKLNKYQKWERSFASSAGELKSCIADLIKFSKFPSLLNKNSLNLLSTIYIYRKNDSSDEIIISHGGGISGGQSEFQITYNNNWKIKDIHITMHTV